MTQGYYHEPLFKTSFYREKRKWKFYLVWILPKADSETKVKINNFFDYYPRQHDKREESDTGKEQSIKQVSVKGSPLRGTGAQLYQGSSEKWCITTSKLSYWVANESGVFLSQFLPHIGQWMFLGALIITHVRSAPYM